MGDYLPYLHPLLLLNNEILKNGNVRVCSSDNKLALGPNITDPKKTAFLQISHVYNPINTAKISSTIFFCKSVTP